LSWGIVELFAGLGNVARSFEATGAFETVLLSDLDAKARDTVIANEPDAVYRLGDVRGLHVRHLREAAKGREITGILGCPPCQGFSAAGRRDAQDDRNGLLADYFRLVLQAQPAFFVAENVPAVYQSELLARALSIVERRYVVWRGVVNAALFGLPQTRQRAILIGYRRDLGVIPGPPATTHLGRRPVFNYRTRSETSPSPASVAALLGEYPKPWPSGPLSFEAVPPSWKERRGLVTVGEAIGDLPMPGKGGPLGRASAYSGALRRGARTDIANHEAWRHDPELIERVASVPEGGVMLRPANGKRYYSGAYARLHRAGLARTITTNFHNAGSGRFLHPTQHRTLTVREAARLQGIADRFVFIGDRSDQERLVGNSFPPPMAAAIARRVIEDLTTAGY
jgi:DNA (cytosine-5)-methyltransferase 1